MQISCVDPLQCSVQSPFAISTQFLWNIPKQCPIQPLCDVPIQFPFTGAAPQSPVLHPKTPWCTPKTPCCTLKAHSAPQKSHAVPKKLTLHPKNPTLYPKNSHCTQEPHIAHYEYMQQPMLRSHQSEVSPPGRRSA
uniref:Uncharacterized protein n=1 Tax=Phasianus colchicus TaxID=9054 RepID=A0A669QL58_PHACC